MSKEDSTSEQRCDECGHEFCNNCRLACCECAHVRRDKVLERYASEAAAEDQNSNNAAKNSSGPRTESKPTPELSAATPRLNSKIGHEWHVAINAFNMPQMGNGGWAQFMYEAKNLADEVGRMAALFKLERTDGLRKIHQQCSRSAPVEMKENFLSCCLGKRCSECPYLTALNAAKITPEQVDSAKAWTCAAHILTEKGKQPYLDTSEGYLLTEDDKLYWQNVYASMAATDEPERETETTTQG